MAVTRRDFVRLGTSAGIAATSFRCVGSTVGALAIDEPLASSPLKFTRYYAGRTGKKIIRDRRFKTLLPTLLPNPSLSYWCETPLQESLPTFFSLAGPVVVDHHRWVAVQTAVAHDATTRGLFWMDTAPPELTRFTPSVIWANLLTDGPTSQLYLFSDKQLSTLSASQIPNNFKAHLGRWLSINSGRYQGSLTRITCTSSDDQSVGRCFPDQFGMSYYFYKSS
jgi:hypothetical protein